MHHLDASLAQRVDRWQHHVDKLTQEVERSDEAFIKHLKTTYREALPPVWAVCEVMTLGLLSRWYNNLRPMRLRRAIANTYGVDEQVLASWLRHLALLRNTCAHHGRLWNREFTITPLLPRNKPQGMAEQCRPGSRKLYNSLVILLHCMDVVAPAHRWRQRLMALIKARAVPVTAMGFPMGWRGFPLWQEDAA